MTKVIVIGRNYTSRLGMIRAVGCAGYEVVVIRTNGVKKRKDIDAYSKYVKTYLFAKEPNKDLLIQTILSLKDPVNGKVILLPVDDYAASVIDTHIDTLKEDFLFPNIQMQQGAVVSLMDKSVQKKIALEIGLKVAKGWTVEIINGGYNLPPDIIYPCFPKPQISFQGDKKCMKKCSNEEELKCILDEIAKVRDCSMLIEQYVKIEKEFALLGVSDGKTVFIPGMIEMLQDGQGAHKGVTLKGKIIPVNDYVQFITKLETYIEIIKFTGLFDIDAYVCKDGFFFNELNMRFGASGYAITHSGVNLPERFINILLNKPSIKKENMSLLAVFVNEKVANDDYISGFINRKEYNSFINSSNFTFIKSKADLMPYFMFTIGTLKIALLRYINRIPFANSIIKSLLCILKRDI